MAADISLPLRNVGRVAGVARITASDGTILVSQSSRFCVS
jgi:hypothetical protein